MSRIVCAVGIYGRATWQGDLDTIGFGGISEKYLPFAHDEFCDVGIDIHRDSYTAGMVSYDRVAEGIQEPDQCRLGCVCLSRRDIDIYCSSDDQLSIDKSGVGEASG